MRLQQYLNELFDSKVKISSDYVKNEYYDYDFSVNDIEYEVSITKNVITKDKDFNSWTVEFQALSDTLSTTDITGDSNAFKVFAAVFKCIEDFAKKEKLINNIIIYAKLDEPSRVRLYNKLIKSKVKKFGYSLIKKYKENNYMKYEINKIRG